MTNDSVPMQQLCDKKILLAEDSADNAFLISHYICSQGGHVDVVTDGLLAVQAATQNEYDCILMDVQMPVMDGLEATRKLRNLGFAKPILALTAHALPSEIAQSILAGCNLHLTKPISRHDLVSALSSQIL